MSITCILIHEVSYMVTYIRAHMHSIRIISYKAMSRTGNAQRAHIYMTRW
jgi:hypothetical protein